MHYSPGPQREGVIWTQEDFYIVIIDRGIEILRISIAEALEGAGRELVEKHIKEIERTPWIKEWHKDFPKISQSTVM